MRFLLVFLLGFLLITCQSKDGNTELINNITSNSRESANDNIYFSIDSKDNITGKVRLAPLAKNGGENNIILPFSTKDMRNSIDILSSTGDYNGFTAINYKLAVKNFSGPSEISFVPELGEPQSNNSSLDDLPEGIYLLKSGLERTFIYQNKVAVYYENKFDNVNFKSIDWIAVNLPKQSRGIEFKNGRTTSPEPEYISGSTKFFNYRKNREEKIVISYILPANKNLEKFSEIVAKLFAIGIGPLAEFILLRNSILLAPRRKKFVTTFLIIFQIILVITLGWLSWLSIIPGDKVTDTIFVALGSIIAILMQKLKP